MEFGKNLPTVGVGGCWFYEDIVAQGHNFGAVFLSVSVPISGWWGGSHAMCNRKAQTLMAANELEEAIQLLQIKMKSAWDELTSAHRKMGQIRESIAQSTENLRMYDSFSTMSAHQLSLTCFRRRHFIANLKTDISTPTQHIVSKQ